MRAWLCMGVAALLGCGSKGSKFDADGSTDDDGSVDEGGIIVTDGGTEGGACDLTCSSDLHNVIDCNGTTVMACPPDQGCGAGGMCVPACESAKANKSTIGCDYWMWPPEIISAGTGACFAAFVANTWTENVTITLDRANQSLPVMGATRIPTGSGQAITYTPLPNNQLPPGQVAIVFVSRSGNILTSCPQGVTPAYTASPANLDGTGIGSAIHMTTSRPVVAYDIFPYGGGQSAATSATLLIPTSAWDTNYVGVNAYRRSMIVAGANPSMALVAQQDGTTITISPTAAIVGGGGVMGTGKGVPKTYTINKGQFLQLSQPEELTGSAIQSNNPIALFAGAGCLNIDVSDSACDSAHQQIPPVKALGNEYAAVGNEVYGDLGGPETVNVVPPAQFLSSYIFFTDPTFGYTDLALVRKKASDNAFKDVTLDCLGTVGGWQAIGNSGFQYTHVRVQHQGAPVGGCDNGLHTVKSAAPFGVTVWGYDAASSYAYPAGASVKPINTIVVPPTPN